MSIGTGASLHRSISAKYAALIARKFPSLVVSISADVVAELREYPRTVTTCANAYVRPLVDRYLGRIESALAARGFRGALWLMHSTAGLISAEAVRAIEADPISLEIMWSRLVTIADEMWATVIRTAFSLIISESQDFASELLDADGESLAHSPRSMPVFNLSLPRAVKAMLTRFPAHTLVPGDVLITNDPWLCAGHLFDIVAVTPVFHDGRLVALMGTVGHVNDIGGTKDSLRVRELYEEGIQIPPMKLHRAGVPNEDLLALLAENVRNPDQAIGDVNSFVAANAMGAARLIDFMREYGVHDLRALAMVVQKRSEQAMRDAIRALPDGEYFAQIHTNPLGEPMRLPTRITIAGDAMEIDFAGAPPQADRGGINCTLNYTASHATYPIKCMLSPTVRSNAGCYSPRHIATMRRR
ncbi:MAG: hydantoinase B/oxoprolinase family protein [Burkholderiales bacterium]